MDPARVKFFRRIGIRTPLWPSLPTREAPPRLESSEPVFRRKRTVPNESPTESTEAANSAVVNNAQEGDTHIENKFASLKDVSIKAEQQQQESQSEETLEKAEQGIWVFEMDIMHPKWKDDFRVNFLRKLSYANVWIPNSRKPPSHQTVTIFDWDDTLLCTSYINFRGDGDIGFPPIKAHFDAIQHFGRSLLELAMSLGRVFIITNAREGWVEYSSKLYLPNLWPVLERVPVISARQHYEDVYPGDYHEWKVRAFISVRESLNSQIITNLISVGDSNIEMDAVHVMGREFAQALIKTIKFREYPSPDELAKQLELVYLKFDRLCCTPRNLKIGLERKCNPDTYRSDSFNPSPSIASSSTLKRPQAVASPSTLQQPLASTVATSQTEDDAASTLNSPEPRSMRSENGNLTIHQKSLGAS